MININLSLSIDNKDLWMRVTLTIFDKYTIVKGNTSSGKTFTVNNLAEAQTGNGFYTITVSGNLKMTIITDTVVDWPVIQDGQIIVLDEYSPLLRDINTLKRTKAYFVIITRNNMDSLKVHCRSVLYIDDSNPYDLKFKHLYNLQDLNLQTYERYDFILTEDLKSSATFFRLLKERCSFIGDVVPAGGRSLIKKKLRKLYKRNPTATILIVYDAADFGFLYDDLFNLIQDKQIKCTIIDWGSFEEYLYNCWFTPKDIDVNFLDFESTENLYEYYLDKVLQMYKKKDLKCYSLEQGCNTCTEKNCDKRHSNVSLIHSYLIATFGYKILPEIGKEKN